MIKILIVEDNDYKLASILSLLKDDLMLEENSFQYAKDIKTAKKMMISNYFDLLILDLVLPLETGDEATPEKGIGFLKDINTIPKIIPPIHIIGLTEFEDFQSKYKEIFANNLWYLVNYKADEINWKEKIKTLINYLISTKIRFIEKQKQDLKFDIAIITALNKPEFEQVLQLNNDWAEVKIPNDATKYYCTVLKKDGKELTIVSACADQMGMTATAYLSTKIINLFSPNYIFMSGICAGIKEKGLNFGDIIIAEQSWDYGNGKMREFENDDKETDIIFEPDPRHIQLNPELKAKINSFLRRNDLISKIQNDCKYNKPNFILKAQMGPVASGSYVVSSKKILDDIKTQQQRKLLGIEMEGYGLFYSAEHSPNQSTKAIIVKSVSDFGDTHKGDNYQDYASYTSANFIYHFILEEFF